MRLKINVLMNILKLNDFKPPFPFNINFSKNYATFKNNKKNTQEFVLLILFVSSIILTTLIVPVSFALVFGMYEFTLFVLCYKLCNLHITINWNTFFKFVLVLFLFRLVQINFKLAIFYTILFILFTFLKNKIPKLTPFQSLETYKNDDAIVSTHLFTEFYVFYVFEIYNRCLALILFLVNVIGPLSPTLVLEMRLPTVIFVGCVHFLFNFIFLTSIRLLIATFCNKPVLGTAMYYCVKCTQCTTGLWLLTHFGTTTPGFTPLPLPWRLAHQNLVLDYNTNSALGIPLASAHQTFCEGPLPLNEDKSLNLKQIGVDLKTTGVKSLDDLLPWYARQ